MKILKKCIKFQNTDAENIDFLSLFSFDFYVESFLELILRTALKYIQMVL